MREKHYKVYNKKDKNLIDNLYAKLVMPAIGDMNDLPKILIYDLNGDEFIDHELCYTVYSAYNILFGGCRNVSSELTNVGHNTIEFIEYPTNNTRVLFNNMSNAQRLDAINDLQRLVGSRVLDYNNDGATIRCVMNNDSFVSKDIMRYIDDVIEIVSLSSTITGKGYASSLLINVCGEYKDKPIVLKVAPIFSSQEEYNACENLQEQIDGLVSFYEKNGFLNINEFVGYENAVAMIYGKDKSKEIYDKIMI